MKRGRTDFDGKKWPVTKLVLPLADQGANLMFISLGKGGVMFRFIDRLRDAVNAVVEVIAGTTLPQPKLIPIKVIVSKPRG